MERKIVSFSKSRISTGPLDPTWARALFLLDQDQAELTSVVPKAKAGTGPLVY